MNHAPYYTGHGTGPKHLDLFAGRGNLGVRGTSWLTPAKGSGNQRRRASRCGSTAGLKRGIPAQERILVAFGNSLTAGLGVSSGETYPARLQEKLSLAGYRYRVINAGVSGDTTAGALRRVEWVLKSKPDIVILELGANDGLRGLNLKDTRENLSLIIQRFQAAGAKVVLAGMKLPPNYGPAYTGSFQGVYVDLAKHYDIPLIPFFLEGVATKTDLNQADGIHPTGPGYAVVVDTLWPTLLPLLQK